MAFCMVLYMGPRMEVRMGLRRDPSGVRRREGHRLARHLRIAEVHNTKAWFTTEPQHLDTVRALDSRPLA